MRRFVLVVLAFGVLLAGCEEARDLLPDTSEDPLGVETEAPECPEIPPPPRGECEATVTVAEPPQNGAQRVCVNSRRKDTPFTAVVHYRSTDTTYEGQTDEGGHGNVRFTIGRATAGRKVTVEVKVGSGRRAETCSADFHPRAS